MSNLIQESMEAYQARQAMSAGVAWTLVNECPLLAWHRSPFNPDYEPEHKREFDIGTAAHLALLQPDEFNRCVVELAFENYLTKQAQQQRDAARKLGRTPLLAKDVELVYRICHRIEEQCDLFQNGLPEVTYLWEWEGVPCKARVDYLANRRPRGMLLCDLKTAASASPAAFARAMVRDGHHLRAAWYIDGYLQGVSTEPAAYRYVVVGKDEPHIVSEFEVGERSLAWGRALYRRALQTFKTCMNSGIWSGYVEKPTPIELPPYIEYQLADMKAEGTL